MSCFLRLAISARAELTAAVVDKIVAGKGTRKVAEAYLNYLYSPKAQETAARHYCESRLTEIAVKYDAEFPEADLFTIDELSGGWQRAYEEHFSDGSVFEQRYTRQSGMIRKAW